MAIIGRTRRTPHPLAGRNEVEDGGTRTFLSREECRPSRGLRAARRVGWESGRGRKSEARRCGIGRRGEAVVWRYSPLERPQGGAGMEAKGAVATRPAAKGDPRRRQGEPDRCPTSWPLRKDVVGSWAESSAPRREAYRGRPAPVEDQESNGRRDSAKRRPAPPHSGDHPDGDRKRVTQTRLNAAAGDAASSRRGRQASRKAGRGITGGAGSVFGGVDHDGAAKPMGERQGWKP